MQQEFIQIGSNITRADNGFLLPLWRGFAGTRRESHPAGPWVIATSPSSGDFGRDVVLAWTAFTLPALTATQDDVVVSEAVGAMAEPGMVLVRLRAIE
ncbi:MAG TPA: hypothetical protein VKF59_01040 [Candidatus Dormibacteraeota bacterium]|nr:hypothetical protein [Candidatus Dormibacteraeota bacterium]